MKKVVDWAKAHPLAAAILLLVIYLFLNGFSRTFLGTSVFQMAASKVSAPSYEIGSNFGAVDSIGISPDSRSYVPQSQPAPSESTDRMVVTDTSLSMVVKKVRDSVSKIVSLASDNGGYMVSQSLSQPEEAPYANLTVRVLSDHLDAFLEEARGLAVKVTMEQINGTDVTDQYEDLSAKITIYERNMTKFNELMDQTDDIDYLLQIQRELINLQNQIDSLKGRQKYLEQTAKLAKVTLHLSTDEWSLPYAPAKSFRPSVIFKQAVRSLVTSLRGLAEKLIWIAVYAVIWGPVLALFLWLRKRKRNHPKPAAIQ